MDESKSYAEDLARINRRERLAGVQSKINRIYTKLEDPTLAAKKRTRLEAKLKGLLTEKDHLLDRK